MTETTQDAYVKGYNQGRADAELAANGGHLFKTPDISPAQIVGIVSAAVATAVAFGVDLSTAQQHVLIGDAVAVAALFGSDAVIRHGRATGNAKKDG